MKLNNGKNIITSKDITMVGDSANLGNDLDDILTKLQEELRAIKSNVKWLYKYGGVGSGSGTGGSTSDTNSEWFYNVTFGGKSITDGGSIILSGDGYYYLSVFISNPKGREFTVAYSTGGRYSTKLVLNSSNGWTLEIRVYISSTSDAPATLTVRIVDDNNEAKVISTSVITHSYTFEANLVKDDGSKYGSGDLNLYISNIKQDGFKLAIDYSIVVSFLSCILKVTFNGSLIEIPIEPSLETTNLKDTVYVDLLQYLPEDFGDNDAGTYQWTFDVDLLLGTTLESISLLTQTLQLIPEGFYILITPVSGTIYNNDVEDHYTYLIGTINLNLMVYGDSLIVNGDAQHLIKITPEINGEEQNDFVQTYTLNERKKTVVLLNASLEGDYKFTFTRENVTDPSKAYSRSIYLYTVDKYKDISYYDDKDNYGKNTVIKSYYYRTGYNDTIDLGNEALYKMTTNSSEKTITGLDIGEYGDHFSTVVHFGLKYSKINNSNNPIFTIKGSSSYYTFYNNKVTYNGATTGENITINKCDEFNTDSDGYHLVTFCLHEVSEIDSIKFYEKTVYIDGVLEAKWDDFDKTYFNIQSITLHKANYYINLLEVDYINPYDYSYIDIPITNFSKAYKLKKLDSGNGDKEFSILNILKEHPYTFKNNCIVLSSDAVSNLSQNNSIPTMLFVVTKDTQESVINNTGGMEFNMDNFQLNFGDKGVNSPFASLEFVSKVYYAKAASYESDGEFVEGENVLSDDCCLNSKYGNDLEWYFQFQGTSTLSFASKNLYFGVKSVNLGDTSAYVPVFTPNFSYSDTTSFLPETGFNLKADVVDSSHSNNNACGHFINTETPKIFDMPSYKYNDYVKNCLEGFPVLVIMNIMEGEDTLSKDFYLLGIYNFNLTRTSYFNLGYADLESDLDTSVNTNLNTSNNLLLQEGFNLYWVKSTAGGDIQLRENFWSAEISENTPGFDFSLFHRSVLFEDTSSPGNTDNGAMFSNLVYYGDKSETLNKIYNFAKATTKAGAYVFQTLLKNFGTRTEMYSATDSNGVSKNLVPDYNEQYIRKLNGEWDLIDENSDDYTKIIPLLNDLTDFVDGDVNNGISPIIDYESIVNAFVAIMALGLVDSILKNSTWKSWGSIVKAAFYDMDTCFGVDNSGNMGVDFKAFSDYWSPNIDKNNNVGNTIIYRDYKPSDFNGFDIPCSYMWAVAKYATTANNLWSTSHLDPLKLWRRWRTDSILFEGGLTSRKGPFYNADLFISNFYENHTKDIDPIIKNLNYRFKYFKLETSSDGTSVSFNSDNASMFNGTRVEYVRDWLNNRLHFLDMCFNLQCVNLKIEKYNLETGEYEDTGAYYCNQATSPGTENPDIIICRNIFSSTGSTSKQSGYDFVISAIDYSPLIITRGSVTSLYLLEDSGTSYRFYELASGGQISYSFGGSPNWVSLNDISSFVDTKGIVYIDSDNLEEIYCLKSTALTKYNFTLPSLRVINLSSNPLASGSLEFSKTGITDNYPNLKTINISNTKINLTVNGEGVQEINVAGVDSSYISITNCDYLTSLTLVSGSNKLKLSNYLSINYGSSSLGKTVSLDGHSINKYILSTNLSGSSCTIQNDSVVTEINLTGYEKVTIQSCSNLKTITLDSSVKELYVKSCNSIFTVNDNIFSTGVSLCDFSINSGNGVIDLSKLTSLTTLNMYNTRGFYKVILPETDKGVNLLALCFLSTLLKYLEGGLANITGNKTFNNALLYQMKQSDNSTYSKLKISASDLQLTFAFDDSTSYCLTTNNFAYRWCKLTIDDVNYFLSLIPQSNNITNIYRLFYKRGIVLDIDEMISKYNEGTSHFVFKNLPNVTNATQVFGKNYIPFWNKYMFDSTFGSSSGVNVQGFVESYSKQNHIYATIDYLSTIASKITQLSAVTYTTSWQFGDITFIDPENYKNDSGTVIGLDEINLSEVLYNNGKNLDKLTSIYGFCPTNKIINFNSEDSDSSNTYDCFRYTPNITTIQYSFNTRGTTQFFKNFNRALSRLPKLKTISAFSFNAMMTPEDDIEPETVDLYNLINWELFLNNSDCTFYEGYTYASDGHKVSKGFSFLKTISGDNYRKLWELLLKSKISGISNLFSYCTLLSTDATIPEFKNTTIKSLYRTFYLFKALNNGYLTFGSTLFKSIVPESGVVNMTSCFESTKLAETIPFNFFNTRYKTETNVIVGDDISAKLIEYKYSDNVKFTLDYCWYNCTFGGSEEKKYFDDNDSVTPNKIVAENGDENSEELKDSEGNPYTTYKIANKEYTFELNTEYLDILRLGPIHTGQARNQSLPFTGIQKLFITPDILYNLNANGSTTGFNYLFYRCNLAGTIPWNMTSKNGKTCSFANAFYLLDIIPYCVYEYPDLEANSHEGIYQFIPDNFTTYSTLSNAFNFKMRIPDSGDESNNSIYLVCSNKSIGFVALMKSAMPVNNGLLNRTSSNTDTTSPLNISTVPIRYNFIGIINDGLVTYGLNGDSTNTQVTTNISNNTDFTSMFDKDTLAILYGNIFNGYTVTSSTKGTSILTLGYSSVLTGYVSNYLKLPDYSSKNTNYLVINTSNKKVELPKRCAPDKGEDLYASHNVTFYN